VTAIDFAHSNVTWLLPEQPSYGRFAVEASLTDAVGETFYLCKQVFAGHVYGDEALFKTPPYKFSAAFSLKRYRIFRDAVRGPVQEDSSGPITERFREVKLDIRHVASVTFDPGRFQAWETATLCARVTLSGCDLEFPVRHINWKPGGVYQVETGPVLVLQAGEGDVLTRLRRGYVILNSSRAEFLIDSDRSSGRRWTDRISVDCVVRLLRVKS